MCVDADMQPPAFKTQTITIHVEEAHNKKIKIQKYEIHSGLYKSIPPPYVMRNELKDSNKINVQLRFQKAQK